MLNNCSKEFLIPVQLLYVIFVLDLFVFSVQFILFCSLLLWVNGVVYFFVAFFDVLSGSISSVLFVRLLLTLFCCCALVLRRFLQGTERFVSASRWQTQL